MTQREAEWRVPPVAPPILGAKGDLALPPLYLRTAELARSFAALCGAPAALFTPTADDPPIIHALDGDSAAHERRGAAWVAPAKPGLHPLVRGDQVVGFAVSVRFAVGPQHQWMAALLPAMPDDRGPIDRAVAVMEGIAAAAASEWSASARYMARLETDLFVRETAVSMARAGVVTIGVAATDLRADDRSLSILRLSEAPTLDCLLSAFAPHDRATIRAACAAAPVPGRTFCKTCEIDRADGTFRAIRVRVQRLEGDPYDLETVITVSDVTDEVARIRANLTLAERDPLTGLYNRGQLDRIVNAATEAAQRTNTMAGLLLIRVDDFPDIMRRHGRTSSDALIRFMARAVSNLVRASDSVIRLGEADFGVVLSEATSSAGIAERARVVFEALQTTVTIEETPMEASASLGFAIYPNDTQEGLDLYGAASYALNEKAGTRQFSRFDKKIRQQRESEIRFIDEIRQALTNREFQPFFQPKVDLETGLVVGFEALCRWRHPDRGVLTPGAFWPALESPIVGADLSNVTLIGSFQAANMFRKMELDFGHIAINLATQQLMKPDLVDLIMDLQLRFEVQPSEITFEILENVLFRDKDTITGNLHRLSQVGYRLALDDFGTGFASLSHVREPFIREVKVDRSFVTSATPSSQQIVTAIVHMARKLNLSLVAEGIEDEETLRKLRAIGCKVGQGFVFAPALPFEEAAEFLGRQRRIYELLSGTCI
ncbi:MAG: GGDEF domain-containing phosphodiesterase [Pseudomonadota bacterium]